MAELSESKYEYNIFMDTVKGGNNIHKNNIFMDTVKGGNNIHKNNIFMDTVKGGNKMYQEDSFFVLKYDKILIAGVFDGHGSLNGMKISNLTKSICEKYFEECKIVCRLWNREEWAINFKNLFNGMHELIRHMLLAQNTNSYCDDHNILKTKIGVPIKGGTTATIVVQIDNDDSSKTFVSSNVGDSFAMLLFPEGEIKYHFLTTDHCPESYDEWKRVQELPMDKYPLKLKQIYDVKPEYSGSLRIPIFNNETGDMNLDYKRCPHRNKLVVSNVRNEYSTYVVVDPDNDYEINDYVTGLAMTRSLGDFYIHPFGVVSDPSVNFYTLPAGQECGVVVATDGVWDCWKFNDFHEYYMKQIKYCKFQKDVNIVDGLKIVFEESVRAGIDIFGKNDYDDTSLISWFIENKL
jgi:serine/threonine protein phosphatase PrpC